MKFSVIKKNEFSSHHVATEKNMISSFHRVEIVFIFLCRFCAAYKRHREIKFIFYTIQFSIVFWIHSSRIIVIASLESFFFFVAVEYGNHHFISDDILEENFHWLFILRVISEFHFRINTQNKLCDECRNLYTYHHSKWFQFSSLSFFER